MSLFRADALRQRGRLARNVVFGRTASQVLRSDATSATASQAFDIFLSHSYLDADVILGLKEVIKAMGYSVYVDWVNDADLDRSKVDRASAERIRGRLTTSRS